jgi:hypothetical protein
MISTGRRLSEMIHTPPVISIDPTSLPECNVMHTKCSSRRPTPLKAEGVTPLPHCITVGNQIHDLCHGLVRYETKVLQYRLIRGSLVI